MKKINLFLSSLIIALVFLVVGSATLAPAMQLKSMSLNADSTSVKTLKLFDDAGRYAISKADLDGRSYYEFFGYNWYLVKISGNVATFWMVAPYTKTYFNQPTSPANIINDNGSNIWANGYSNTVRNNATGSQTKDLGPSHVRQFLIDEAVKMIDDSVYGYKGKVVAGTVVGSNEPNEKAHKEIAHLQFAQDDTNHVVTDGVEKLTAYYELGNSDRLWLPSVGDLKEWKILNDAGGVVLEKETILKWTDNTISNRAWLRNPGLKLEESSKAAIISSHKESNSYFGSMYCDQEIGVRPAIHLDITNLETEYQEHLDSVDNSEKNWFTKMWDDDWLKAMFMVVCILGVIGVTAVIIAVVAKARRKK